MVRVPLTGRRWLQIAFGFGLALFLGTTLAIVLRGTAQAQAEIDVAAAEDPTSQPVTTLDDGSTDKLVAFPNFYNAHRVHASLDGRTPVPIRKDVARLDRYRWDAHCRGLYQTPIAA